MTTSKIKKEDMAELLDIPSQRLYPSEKIREDETHVYYRVLGQRRMKDGSIKSYTYISKKLKTVKQKRGRKGEPNKKELRSKILELNDEMCKKVLEFINTFQQDNIDDAEQTE